MNYCDDKKCKGYNQPFKDLGYGYPVCSSTPINLLWIIDNNTKFIPIMEIVKENGDVKIYNIMDVIKNEL